MSTILVVDDEKDFRDTLAAILSHEGHRILTASNGDQAVTHLQHDTVDAVFLDIKMPHSDGLAVLDAIKKLAPDLPVIMLTAFEEVATAVDAMKKGAFDYLSKTFDHDELLVRLKKALDVRSMSHETEVYRALSSREPTTPLIGTSTAIQQVRKQIEQVAGTALTVLITGPSGTGKEIVARLIHRESPRRARPFVPIDCGALPDTLIESELFGYEKGAFTGAQQRKPGYFEMAFQSTLFLDEIGNLSLGSQAKLLRALEQRVIQRLGGTKSVSTDVRVIAATNVELHGAVDANRFRQDLLHRLEEFLITLPRLQDRQEDIMPLAEHFLAQAAVELRKSVPGFTAEARESLQQYPWPGNIRELRNSVKQAALLADEGRPVDVSHLRIQLRMTVPASVATPMMHADLKQTTAEMERHMILDALHRSDNNRSHAAKLLGLPRSVLYEKLKKYHIGKQIP